MTVPSSCLLLGGAASFLIVLLHLALALRPQWYRHFGADELAQMHEQGSRFTVVVTLGLTVKFALWGIYALSGAGVIGQLPLLRSVLIAIGAIYVLRSLMLPSEPFEGPTAGRLLALCRLFDRLFGSGAALPGRYIDPI